VSRGPRETHNNSASLSTTQPNPSWRPFEKQTVCTRRIPVAVHGDRLDLTAPTSMGDAASIRGANTRRVATPPAVVRGYDISPPARTSLSVSGR
jgi:hypothetical protein